MATTKTISVSGGQIIASVEDDLVVAQNLHFAKQQRFEPPKPLEPWSTPRDCTQPGPICPQLKFVFAPLGSVTERIARKQDEDCLLVNIVAPVNAKDLPVAVWFTGGAYISGFADLKMYDTRPLARQGVVAVNVQYRLGVFGYATIPGVAPPNLGLQDQIAGMKWVQENIAAFGGDARRVTAYGQSAGADSIYGMMLADGTEGLFQQAVIMSAPFGIFVQDKPESEILSQAITEKSAGEDLRTLPTARLLDIQQTVIERRAKAGVKGPGFILTYGAEPLPPLAATKDRLAQRASKIRVLVGWTKDDALPFIMAQPSSAILPKIPLVGNTILHGLGRLVTYFLFSRGAQQLLSLYREYHGTASTYVIEYYPEHATFLAAHCMELTLLFSDYEWWSETPLLGHANRAEYERLAIMFKSLFLDFVRGRPFTADHYRVHKDFVYESNDAKL